MQKNVLDMSLIDSEAEGLSAETGDRQFLLLEKLQKLLLPAAEQSPSSAEARPQGVKGFESKLQEVQTLLKQVSGNCRCSFYYHRVTVKLFCNEG